MAGVADLAPARQVLVLELMQVRSIMAHIGQLLLRILGRHHKLPIQHGTEGVDALLGSAMLADDKRITPLC